MSIIGEKSLHEIIRNPQIKGKKIAFCSGSFDLTHAGHILFFEDCKKQADVLVVGVGSDEFIQANKGSGRPILNEHVRLKTIDSLRSVDYAFIQTFSASANPLADSLIYVFENLKPHVYIVNDDAYDLSTRDSLAKQYGVTLIILNRVCPLEFKKISTSNIIEKIKRLP